MTSCSSCAPGRGLPHRRSAARRGARGRLGDQRGGVRRLIATGPERTAHQDAAFGLRQLVDIGARGLSPGINDPTTAVQALGQIHDALLRLGSRKLHSGVLRDDDGRVRVLAPVHSLGRLRSPRGRRDQDLRRGLPAGQQAPQLDARATSASGSRHAGAPRSRCSWSCSRARSRPGFANAADRRWAGSAAAPKALPDPDQAASRRTPSRSAMPRPPPRIT